jgi:hypothetical protein
VADSRCGNVSVMRLDLWDVFSLVFEYGIKGYRLEAHHQDMLHWLFPGNIATSIQLLY